MAQGYGVVGSSVEAGAEEVENAPALSLVLASLPGVQLTVTHADADLPDGGDQGSQPWHSA
jgi:small ligand-binding sensory domain FIST